MSLNKHSKGWHGFLTISHKPLGWKSSVCIGKHKTIKLDVVGERPATKCIQISWTNTLRAVVFPGRALRYVRPGKTTARRELNKLKRAEIWIRLKSNPIYFRGFPNRTVETNWFSNRTFHVNGKYPRLFKSLWLQENRKITGYCFQAFCKPWYNVTKINNTPTLFLECVLLFTWMFSGQLSNLTILEYALTVS